MDDNLLTIPHDEYSPLPETATTLSGVTFYPRLSIWAYREPTKNISLNFSEWTAAPALVQSGKKVLIWYAENKSPSHLKNLFERFQHLLRNTIVSNGLISEIDSTILLNYRGTLSSKQAWYLGALTGFFQKWYDLGVAGVTDDAVVLLDQLRIQGNRKGEAVLTLDPRTGPFSDIEVEAIQAVLTYSFDQGIISLEKYMLVWLFLALGQRPIQYAAMKVCDIDTEKSSDGLIIYTLKVPRAKQRGRLSRDDFSNRTLIPELGERLLEHSMNVRKKYADSLPNSSDAPLFPVKRSKLNEPTGFEYHNTAELLASNLKEVINVLKIKSERTGEPLHVTATRFKRTLATRAAMEGHGELVIAELLDHNDTQNVGVEQGSFKSFS